MAPIRIVRRLNDSSQITASLSAQLITVAVAVLGGALALMTFFADNRTGLGWFYAVTSIAVALAVVSIFFGGWGIDALANNRSAGGHFNAQSLALALALLVLAASVIIGNSTSGNATTAYEQRIVRENQLLAERVGVLGERLTRLGRQQRESRRQIVQLQREGARLGRQRRLTP